MENLINLIYSDESPSQVRDEIKDILFAKSADKIQNMKSSIASKMFDLDGETEDS